MTKILVVDDDAASRQLALTLIRHAGYQPLEASDGAEALGIVREQRPQLVMSDILMPTMDGYELVRRLRLDPDLADTEVIFLTAQYREREARNLAKACGVARLLVKPCEPEDILRAMEQALAHAAEPAPAVTGEFSREHLRLLADKLAQEADQLRLVNARLEALTELNLQLASELGPRALLEKLCRGARDLIGSRYAVVAVKEKAGEETRFFATSGIEASLARTLPAPHVDEGLLGQVGARRLPLRLEHLGGSRAAVGLPSEFPPVHSCLAVPIASLYSVYGWICLVDKLGADAYTDEDERLLTILGAQVGRIYENGSLYLHVKHRADALQLEVAERRRAVEELLESELRFRQLAENMREVFFLTDTRSGAMLYVSPAYEEIWGSSPEELYRDPQSWIARIHDEDRVRVVESFARMQATGRVDLEYRITRPDGSSRWIWTRAFPIRDGGGALYRVAGVAEDITDRKRAEDKIRRLNRVHAVLSNVNALIVRVRHRDELFRQSCRLAVDHGRFRLAWIGLVDVEENEFKPVAWAGQNESFMTRARIPMHIAARAGPNGSRAAIVERLPHVCNDIERTLDDLPERAEMLERGLHSFAALPLVVDGTTVGVFALYTDERDFFDEREMELLNELAGDVSFALDHIDKEDRLNYIAYYDSLTGLANRMLFQERLSPLIAAAARTEARLAIIILDVERFRSINDSFGRHIGDELLRRLAERLTGSIGNADEIARLGGDQFAIMVTEMSDETDVVRELERSSREVFGPVFELEQGEIRLSAKSGIAICPMDGNDADTLLRHAEVALKRAKRTGDGSLFYTHQMSERVTEKLSLETKLRRALDAEELMLYYQPRVDLETRKIKGVEALMRWRNAALGLVLPSRFIPVMEETGIILAAGAWALQRAAEDRMAWAAQGRHAPRVAVNVSAIQLRKDDFEATVERAIACGGADPGIDLEVTESLIMEDVEANIEKLQRLRARGIDVAIDDFGTGYSSLAYLAKLPVASLKIDRSFISGMLDNPGAMSLVSTMISLGHSLKLTVVAEGVESEDQAKILRLLRCNEMQGYLVGQAVPALEMGMLLEPAA